MASSHSITFNHFDSTTGLPPGPSYYAILALPSAAIPSTASTPSQRALLRKAYHRALLRHHPDKLQSLTSSPAPASFSPTQSSPSVRPSSPVSYPLPPHLQEEDDALASAAAAAAAAKGTNLGAQRQPGSTQQTPKAGRDESGVTDEAERSRRAGMQPTQRFTIDQIVTAYETLSTPARRSEYDCRLAAAAAAAAAGAAAAAAMGIAGRYSKDCRVGGTRQANEGGGADDGGAEDDYFTGLASMETVDLDDMQMHTTRIQHGHTKHNKQQQQQKLSHGKSKHVEGKGEHREDFDEEKQVVGENDDGREQEQPETGQPPTFTTTTRWTYPCRCGNAVAYEVSEEELEEALADEEDSKDAVSTDTSGSKNDSQKKPSVPQERFGEIIVGCKDCSLWLRVRFAAVEDHDEEDYIAEVLSNTEPVVMVCPHEVSINPASTIPT